MVRLPGILTRGRGLQATETEWPPGLENVGHYTEGKNKSAGVGFLELTRQDRFEEDGPQGVGRWGRR